MTKSQSVIAVDAIQAELRPVLKQNGYQVRGRTFNRLTEDGLTQVVNIQISTYGPTGITGIPGLREDLHGLFAINLGVYVPEVAEKYGNKTAKSWVQDYNCCVRTRLGELIDKEMHEIWWKAIASEDIINDILHRLKKTGLVFLNRFATRDKIINEYESGFICQCASTPARIVMAIIHAERGDPDKARQLLSKQIQESKHAGHHQRVSDLAVKLGLGDLSS